MAAAVPAAVGRARRIRTALRTAQRDALGFHHRAEHRLAGFNAQPEEFAAKKKLTRRERFLREIDAVTPWAELSARIEPFYPKGTGRGRPPIGLARMLRMYVVQQCLGLSDEGVEDAVYDSQAIRGFIGIDLAREAAPDATTLLKFRRPLETHGLTKAVFEAINAHLAAKGLLLREGSVVDATIISAPSSSKNDSGTRDPQMHQTRKGKNWFFESQGPSQ